MYIFTYSYLLIDKKKHETKSGTIKRNSEKWLTGTDEHGIGRENAFVESLCGLKPQC